LQTSFTNYKNNNNMKITLLNGNVVEGTFDELNQAGLLQSNTMAARALKPQLDLFPAQYQVSETQAQEEKQVPEVATIATVEEPKTGRPFNPLTVKVHDALAKAKKTGNEQRIAVASKDELKVRQVVTRFNRVNKTKFSANKIRVGDRIAMVLSQ
jgi:hypothetical protein